MSEPRAIEQTLTIPYSWGYGAGLEMFFSGTRDRKIIGLRCPSCEGVIVPPSEVCGRCFAQLDWDQPVELPPRARLESWTEIHLPFPGQPTQPPYILGLICFEGAATLFTHLIGETEEDKLALGLPLDVIWAEERSGDLYDIQHLRPADPALRVAPRRFAPTIGVDQDAEAWEPPVP